MRECPSEEMFADYLGGRLTPSEVARMEAHLSHCEECFDELIVASRIVQRKTQEETGMVPARLTHMALKRLGIYEPVLKRLRCWIRRFYAITLQVLQQNFSNQWRLVPVRGSERVRGGTMASVIRRFGDIAVEIKIEKTANETAAIRARVLRDEKEEKGKIRVTLKKKDRDVASFLLESGYALFEEIPFNDYSLFFERDGIILGSYSFKIKEASHAGD